MKTRSEVRVQDKKTVVREDHRKRGRKVSPIKREGERFRSDL